MAKKKQKQQIQDEYSPINTRKINALSAMYANLPKSGFSKLVVTFCLMFSLIAIITSFVFLYLGMDASPVLVPSLGFFGSELLVLGATNIFNREKTQTDLIFDQIRQDINDGYYYDQQGRRIKADTAFVDNSVVNNTYNIEQVDSEVNNNETNNNEVRNNGVSDEVTQEIQEEFNTLTEETEGLTSLPTTTTTNTKKRGRPKKNEVKTVETKITEPEEVQGYEGEFGSADYDGRD